MATTLTLRSKNNNNNNNKKRKVSINGQFTVLLRIFRKFTGNWPLFYGIYPENLLPGKSPVIWKNKNENKNQKKKKKKTPKTNKQTNKQTKNRGISRQQIFRLNV